MPNHAEELRGLHAIQIELAEVRERIEAGPRQIRVQAKRLAKAEAAVAEQEEEAKRIRTIADQKNLDLKSREARVTDLKVKLNSAATNKEYDAISGQIAADEAASSVLEDEILEVFERLDAANAELQIRIEAKEKVTSALANAKTKWAEDEAGLRSEEVALDAKSREAETFIPSQERARFRRSAESNGEDALAQVEDGVCLGCQHKITPQQQILVRQGEIVFCTSCERLLYRAAAPLVT